MTERFI